MAATLKLDRKALLQRLRAQMDQRGEAFKIGAQIRPVTAAGREAEWILAPKADPDRRVLYIHGGA